MLGVCKWLIIGEYVCMCTVHVVNVHLSWCFVVILMQSYQPLI